MEVLGQPMTEVAEPRLRVGIWLVSFVTPG